MDPEMWVDLLLLLQVMGLGRFGWITAQKVTLCVEQKLAQRDFS